MKFQNGMWMAKQGYQISFPQEACDSKINDDSVTVYGPYRKAEHRGGTLNVGILTVTLTAPRKDIISVRLTNFAGVDEKGPAFCLETDETSPQIKREGDCCVFQSGGLSAEINVKGNWGLRFSYNGRELTASEPRSMAYVLDDRGNPYIREQLSLDAGESLYGLGERFSPFIKNGQSVDIWNADGGTDSEQAYKNIPFFVSSKGYGVFVNDPGRVSFEMGSEILTKTQFSVPGESMEYMNIGGETLKEVISNYTALTGRPPLVPDWTFGLWLTTSFTTNYDEATVMSFIDGMLEREIPLTTFHFDCFWMKGFEWCNFLWDSETFPDPEGMLRRIKAKGIKICVWINPYIAQKSRLFAEGVEHGYFVKTGDGSVWQWDMWQAGMALVDFTNPEAVKWYQGYLEELVDMGVDSFKTDFGERIPVRDSFYGKRAEQCGIVYFDGSDPDKMHNYYTQLYNRAVYEVLERKLGKNEACLFARSATVGGQKYPVHWGGDNISNYPSMAQSLRGGLSLSLCGFGYWSHDIGGFEAGCTPDIFKRWTQFGLLSSHSRYHGSSEYKVPWIYDEESVEVTRRFTKLKLRLMPYLYRWAAEAARTGVPMMRPMFLEFPEDHTTPFLDMQYMLGENLLVAPIFNDKGIASYYLPAGNWTNMLTGEVKPGARWHQEQHGYMTFPLLVRENSIIPFGGCDTRPDYDYSDGTTFAVYELQEQTPATAVVYSGKGETLCKVQAVKAGNTIHFTAEGQLKDGKLLLVGISAISSVTGGVPTQTDTGVSIALESHEVTVIL